MNYNELSRLVNSRGLNSGESRVFNVDGQDVLLSRNVYLDTYGNPVYYASVMDKDGVSGKRFRTNGNPALAVRECLEHLEKQRSKSSNRKTSWEDKRR